jgi:hypothetical protein
MAKEMDDSFADATKLLSNAIEIGRGNDLALETVRYHCSLGWCE